MAERNENRLLYIYLFATFLPLIMTAVHIFRNFDIFEISIQNEEFVFGLHIATFVIGVIGLVRLRQYYLKTRSSDYLLISYYIVGSGLAFFFWQTWSTYLSSTNLLFIAGNVNRAEPELMFVRLAYHLSILTLFLVAVRSRKWSDYNIFVKVLIIWFGVEMVGTAIREFLMEFIMWITGDFSFWLGSPWYLRITPLHLLLPGFYIGTLVEIFASIFVIYAFYTIQPENKTPEILISRIIWVIVGFIKLMLGTVNVVLIYVDPFNFDQYIFYSSAATLSFILLISMLVFVPEALLISSYQITKACKLYAYVHAYEPEKGSEFVGFERLREYVQSIPEEIFAEGCD